MMKAKMMFLALPLLIGCTAEVRPDYNPTYTVLVDKPAQAHIEDILVSLNAWEVSTNHIFQYVVKLVDENHPKTEPHTIKVYGRAPEEKEFGGYTNWNEGAFYADIVINPILNSEGFTQVMTHEIGHALGLSYDTGIHYEGPYKSVMHPATYDVGASGIACPDLKAFCKLYSCEVDCQNELPDPVELPACSGEMTIDTPCKPNKVQCKTGFVKTKPSE